MIIMGTPSSAPIIVIQRIAPRMMSSVPIIPATSLPVSPRIPVTSLPSAAKGLNMRLLMELRLQVYPARQ